MIPEATEHVTHRVVDISTVRHLYGLTLARPAQHVLVCYKISSLNSKYNYIFVDKVQRKGSLSTPTQLLAASTKRNIST